jgi:enterochelin esterase-like enzyme
LKRIPIPVLVSLTLIGVIAVTAAAAAALRSRVPDPRVPSERTAAFQSKAVRGTVHLLVLLPPGYADGQLRYPVVYFLHGLPASGGSYRGAEFLRAALARLRRHAILVAPQAARDGDSDPEYLDWGPGRNWETAVAQELPAYVDSHFRTIPHRRGRALVGLSAGGYGAVSLALHHLRDFSVIESWSGYFHPTNPSGTARLGLGSPERDRRADVHQAVRTLHRAFRHRATYFAFYVGREDARFRDENVALDRELTRAGVPHRFAIYPGAHGFSVWAAHAPAWLGTALRHLTAPQAAALPGFTKILTGPGGGTVWRGRIPNHLVTSDRRASAVYLPPYFNPQARYPVIYLLHGFPGSPSGFYDSLRLAQVADGLIGRGRIKPFVAVMPVAGRTTGARADEEWAGVWEQHLVSDVVPWTTAHLPVLPDPSAHAIAGLSAGGFGAVDIALRHPGLFGVVESWSGYFRPFRDGPLATADRRALAGHDPVRLARRESARLRAGGVSFFLSTGFNHGGVLRRWTFEFARELRSLGLATRLWASPRPDGGRYLRVQLPAALEFAFRR